MPATSNVLQWAPGLEIGIPEIDADHRLLIDRSNALLQAMKESRPKAAVMTIIRRMTVECREHFRREEKILRDGQYRKTDEHAAEHRRIEEELEKAVRSMENAEDLADKWNAFALFFQSTLINHLLLFDLKYKSRLLWVRGR